MPHIAGWAGQYFWGSVPSGRMLDKSNSDEQAHQRGYACESPTDGKEVPPVGSQVEGRAIGPIGSLTRSIVYKPPVRQVP